MRTLLALLTVSLSASAADWPQFRGPTADGVTTDPKLPLTWSESENLVWRTALPGPGSSSPIVSGDKVFLTSYSGYGIDVMKLPKGTALFVPVGPVLDPPVCRLFQLVRSSGPSGPSGTSTSRTTVPATGFLITRT